jgi:protein-disulfide isomerase
MDRGMNKKRWGWGFVTACLVWIVLGSACQAQEDRLSRIEKELAEIKADVTAIRQILAGAAIQGPQGPPPAEREVNVGDGPMRGNPKAKVTLIEFSDYQCPFCGRFFNETLPQIDKEFIQTGKVRFVMRDLPLADIHPNAQKAAEAAGCAGEHGKYWQMHDKLFQNQKALEMPRLKEYAKAIGLDGRAFDECLASGKQAVKIQRDLQEARNLGITGTPAFFLGLTKSGKTIKAISIEGAQPIDTFRQEINHLLSQADQPPKQP